MQYIFIHGSWHGSWCWRKLTPYLQKKGHDAICIDLPGHGSDRSSDVSYRDYYDSVEKALIPYREPILVAHSMAGIIAAPLGDRLKLKHTFLIAAILTENLQSLRDVVRKHGNPEMRNAIHEDRERKFSTFDRDQAVRFFYHDASPIDQKWASEQLAPEPIPPLEEPIQWIDTNLTERTYILCEE